MSEWDEIQEEMDAAAAWEQQQQNERRRREDEALERHRKLLVEFRKERKEFNEWLLEHRI